ncbi:unnamed protein product [Malus baccata var. baccata]
MNNTEHDTDALNHSKEGKDDTKGNKVSNPDNLEDLLSSCPWGGGERIQNTCSVCGCGRTTWTDLRISPNNQPPQQKDTIYGKCSVIISCFKINTKMSASKTSANRVQGLWLLFSMVIIYLLIILPCGVEADSSTNVTNVGAIINFSSRIGKEQKTAMEIAAESFNNRSKTHKLILHFHDSGRDPFLAASAAEELIKEKKVEVIVGMDTWEEAAQVADLVGNQTQIPVISFAAPSITPPLMQHRWPFLIRIATDGYAQMKCIADIVSAYHWKTVVVVYEDDGYGGDVGMLALLTEALQDVGSKIEHRLVLPQISSLSNPNWVELEEMLRLPILQSRVFIILQSSLPTVTNLFRLAGKMGLVGKESAWIITESIASLLEPQHTSDMKGTLGIKTYYANNNSSYTNFRKKFQTKYSEGNSAQPGIYALRAYDAIGIISQAIGRMTDNTTSLEVLKTVLSSYTGLSANMRLNGGEVLYSPVFRIVNILDENRFQELNYWKPEVGFSLDEAGKYRFSDVGGVIWPGNLTSAPKGWAMPTVEKPMRILVPGKTSFSKFVKVDRSRHDSDKKKYVGFCIAIFDMVINRLNYSLPYKFKDFNGSYDDLVEQVHQKIFQRGSPIARDFTKVILELLENGEVKKLQNEWLTPKKECPRNTTSNEPESLTLNTFFNSKLIISAATSTLCFLLSFTIWLRRFQHQEAAHQGSASPCASGETLWNKAVRMAKKFYNREINVPTRAPTLAHYAEEWSSPREVGCDKKEPLIKSNSSRRLNMRSSGEVKRVRKTSAFNSKTMVAKAKNLSTSICLMKKCWVKMGWHKYK